MHHATHKFFIIGKWASTTSLNPIPTDIEEAIKERQEELGNNKKEAKQKTRKTIADAHQKELEKSIKEAKKKATSKNKDGSKNKRKKVDDETQENQKKKKKVTKK